MKEAQEGCSAPALSWRPTVTGVAAAEHTAEDGGERSPERGEGRAARCGPEPELAGWRRVGVQGRAPFKKMLAGVSLSLWRPIGLRVSGNPERGRVSVLSQRGHPAEPAPSSDRGCRSGAPRPSGKGGPAAGSETQARVLRDEGGEAGRGQVGPEAGRGRPATPGRTCRRARCPLAPGDPSETSAGARAALLGLPAATSPSGDLRLELRCKTGEEFLLLKKLYWG